MDTTGEPYTCGAWASHAAEMYRKVVEGGSFRLEWLGSSTSAWNPRTESSPNNPTPHPFSVNPHFLGQSIPFGRPKASISPPTVKKDPGLGCFGREWTCVWSKEESFGECGKRVPFGRLFGRTCVMYRHWIHLERPHHWNPPKKFAGTGPGTGPTCFAQRAREDTSASDAALCAR